MTSIGETLRRERLKRNLDLEQISSELKISSRMLEAIEGEHFDRLPGGVFAKSFVRQYARLLGLDEEEMVGHVQRVLEPTPAPNPDVSAIHVPPVEEWEAVGQDRFQLSGSLPAAVLVVIVMLVCSGVYAWLQRPQAPVSAQASPVENAAPQITPQPAPQPTPPVASPAASPDAAPPQPVPSEAAPPQPADPNAPNRVAETSPQQPTPTTTATPALAEAPAAPRPLAPVTKAATSNSRAGVRVEVTAEETVWILARADGKYAFSGTMEAKQSRTVEAASEVVLRFGNAGGVTLQLNGKPIGPAGPKGQVRTLQFTSGGFHIVPAKPPAVPFDPLDRL